MSDIHTSRSWEGIRLNGIPTLTFTGTQNRTAINLNNTDYRVGVVFEVPEDMNITGGACLFSSCGAGNKYKWQLWPASTTAHGTPDTSGTVLAESAAVTATEDTREETTFTSAYAASKGDVLVLVLVVTARANSWVILMGANAHDAFLPASTYSFNAGSSWQNTSDTWPGIEAMTNKAYYLGGIAHEYPNSYYPNNSSNYRLVNKVTLPEETNGIDFHVSGFYYVGLLTYSYQAAEVSVGVWDEAGDKVVATKSYDYPSGFGARPEYEHGCELLFSSPVKMTSGNSYYVGFQYEDTKGQAMCLDLAGDSAMKAWPGGAWMVAYKWEGSAWEATAGDGAAGTVGRVPMNLILTDVHGAEQGTAVFGKGDRGEKTPLDCAKTEKERKTWKTSGARKALGKTVTRENTGYGWNPYA